MDKEFVEDTENLARIIFAPSMIEGDEIAPSAFNLVVLPSGTAEDYVSVERMDYRTPTPETCQFKPRIAGDKVSGYACVLTGEVRRISFDSISTKVEPHPSKKNPYHAGISYSQDGRLVKGDCMPQDLLAVTSLLAKKSTYIKFS